MDYREEILRTSKQRREFFELQSTSVPIRNFEIKQYTPNSLLRYFADRAETLEPELLDWIDGINKGAFYFDIGASTGLYSIYAALNELNVFAFEAEAQNYAVLEVNVFLNAGKLPTRIRALNVALADMDGIGTIYSGRFQLGAHNKILDTAVTRDGSESFQPEHQQSVLKHRLDYLVHESGLPQPDFLKIDIDGAELNALRGGEKVLAGVKGLFIELSDRSDDYDPVMETLESAGFKVAQKVPVAHPDDGVYPGLFNMVFER